MDQSKIFRGSEIFGNIVRGEMGAKRKNIVFRSISEKCVRKSVSKRIVRGVRFVQDRIGIKAKSDAT